MEQRAFGLESNDRRISRMGIDAMRNLDELMLLFFKISYMQKTSRRWTLEQSCGG